MLLLILAVLWGIVLIPPALQSRSERRRVRSVETFRRRLQVLAPAAAPTASRPAGAARPFGAARSHVAVAVKPLAVTLPVRPPDPERAPVPPAVRLTRAAVLRRRRAVLGGLAVAAVLSLAAGLATSWIGLWVAHLLVDVLVVAYAAGLRRLRRLAVERAAKVRYLPVGAVAAAAAVAVADDLGAADTVEMPLRRSASS